VGPHDAIGVDVDSNHAAIVSLHGEHDVDLSACTFIDSSVISVLLRAANDLHTRGGRLSLVISPGGHRAVRTVFDLMNLDRVMPAHETQAAALRALDSTTGPLPATRLGVLSEIIDFSLLDNEERRAA